MIENALLQQIILESSIKLFAFSDVNVVAENTLTAEQLNEYFSFLQIKESKFSEKVEKLFMLLFEHVRNHQANFDIERIKNLFLLGYNEEADGNDEEKKKNANKVAATYADFLMVYGIEVNDSNLRIADKIEKLSAIDYKNFADDSEAKKLYLYSYLDLLLSSPELDYVKIQKVTNELKNFLN